MRVSAAPCSQTGDASVGPPREVTIMTRDAPEPRGLPRSPFLAERAAATLERYLHVEAISGAVLLLAAAAALIWANSPFAPSYAALWHTPLSVALGPFSFSRSLHFWINDGLMTVFFLVIGMEIRREVHEGALSSLRQATLPLVAAIGGVVVPALVFMAMNTMPVQRSGWAVPTATDIAFAVGVLAILGKGIPGNVRIILLALAIVDDVIAVLVIALFYSGGLSLAGLLIAAFGVLGVAGFQRAGIGSAWAYVLPGAVVWTGLLMSGAHPTLAGVVLGLLTPVRPLWRQDAPERVVSRIARDLNSREIDRTRDARALSGPLRQLGLATREILPPAVRVQMALHPWVAYGVMPLFALANAGVAIEAGALSTDAALQVMAGVALALAIGKPVGVVGAVWCAVRAGWCCLPPGVNWKGVVLLGLLAGVGFTMSIFIAMLAYDGQVLLDAARLGVLLGSSLAAILGLAWGAWYVRRR